MGPSIENFALGQGPFGRTAREVIHVGLVNNMPDAAMRATELQFARLLKDASATLGAGKTDVRLHLFCIPDIPRGPVALSRMEGFYADVAALPTAGLDALIVTGAEPRAAALTQEPYWQELAHLIDWAEIGTISTLFSCLAAHAAVWHLDGIARQRLPRKRSGVFAVEQLETDLLFAGLPHPSAGLPTSYQWCTPHSRRNEVPESELRAKGYRVLSRLAGGGGVDAFLRESRSRFLFLQGHPEYGVETLGREYCRDMGRFLRGESSERPTIPEQYFDRATENALNDLAARAGGADDLPLYTAIVAGALPLQSWRDRSLRLFSNWLAMIAAEKTRRSLQSRPVLPQRKRA